MSKQIPATNSKYDPLVIPRLRHPFRVLRMFLRTCPALRRASTQEGLATWLGCSTPLIRAVERGAHPISIKLARMAQAEIGVMAEWLMDERRDDQPIPAARGGFLTSELAIANLEASVARGVSSSPLAGKLVGPVLVVIQRNETSLEHRVHIFDTLGEVRDYRKAASEPCDISEPFSVPRALASTAGFVDAIKAAADALPTFYHHEETRH